VTRDADEEDRKRGILSKADRGYLKNPEEYTRQASHERQTKIRERIEDGMLDMAILYDNIGFIEREIFEHSLRRRIVPKNQQFQNGVRDGLALLLDWSNAAGVLEGNRPVNSIFDRVFESAWERIAWRHRYMLHSVEIEAEAERIPWRDIQERAEAGEEITVEEQAQLLLAYRDEIDPAETQEMVNAALFDDESGSDTA
jgi:hypothetical protein